MFHHNASSQGQCAAVYCLSLGSKPPTDPSDVFLKRFAEDQLAVRKVSECISDPVRGVRDKLTGRSGLIFRITDIKWKSTNEVEVSGGYYEAGLSASGNTYQVVRRHGSWKVVQETMDWIS